MRHTEWDEPKGRRVFVPTPKEADPFAGRDEMAYWVFVGKVAEILGPEGGTLNDIYYRVSAPLGLSLDDTRKLVRSARDAGFLESR